MRLLLASVIPLLLFIATASPAIIIGTASLMCSPNDLLLLLFWSMVLSIPWLWSSLHGQKLLRYVLLRLLEKLYQLSHHREILVAYITVGNSLLSGSSGTPNTMDVVVKASLHWHVIVDDDTDVFYIKASRGDIGGDQDVWFLTLFDWLFELGVDIVSLPLLFVSVDSSGFVFHGVLEVFVPFESFF